MKEPDTSRRSFITWLWRVPVIAVVLGGIYGLYEAYRIQFGKRRPSSEPSFIKGERLELAPLATFNKPWVSQTFSYEDVPAIAIRLPEATAGALSYDGHHIAAFSRVCTHQSCIVNLNDNPEALAVAYNYRSDEPALACRCHFSVFLPGQGGRAVSGPAIEPLPRLELELLEDTVYVTGIEKQT